MADEGIPSYEESVGQSNGLAIQASLTTRILEVQRQRIRTILDTHITNLLYEHVASGLSNMTYALVPSDSKVLQTTTWNTDEVLEKGGSSSNTNEQIVSFADAEYVRLVRLQGQENNSRFWRQQKVIRELEGEVRVILGLDREQKIASKPRNDPEEYDGYLDKKVDWQSNDFSHLKDGEVGVRVTVEEIAIRRGTAVGLYETHSGSAVVIRVVTAAR